MYDTEELFMGIRHIFSSVIGVDFVDNDGYMYIPHCTAWSTVYHYKKVQPSL